MEIVKGWSWWTLALYVLLALAFAELFRQSVISKNKGKKIKIFKWEIQLKYVYYLTIYLIFIIFSSFKYIGNRVGGSDTLNYVKFFNEYGYIHFDFIQTLLFNSLEYIFYNTMYLIKILGGTFRTFLIIINSVIIISLIYFVDKEVYDEKKCIWLVLAFLPLLKSLNIIRNCVAAFIGFISISLLNKGKIGWSIIFAIIAFLNHYISVILFALIVFYKYFPNRYLEDRKKVIISNIISIVLTIALIPILKLIIKNTGYAAYLDNIKISLWGYIPYIIIYILMIADKKFINYLKDCNHYGYYKMVYFLSLILPAFIAVNAAYRILLFFELPIILMSADLMQYYKKYIPKKYTKIYYIGITILIFAYYIFRIYRIWDGNCIMPYYNILFM